MGNTAVASTGLTAQETYELPPSLTESCPRTAWRGRRHHPRRRDQQCGHRDRGRAARRAPRRLDRAYRAHSHPSTGRGELGRPRDLARRWAAAGNGDPRRAVGGSRLPRSVRSGRCGGGAMTSLLLDQLRPARGDIARLLGVLVVGAVPTFASGLVVSRSLDTGFLVGRPDVGLAWLVVLAFLGIGGLVRRKPACRSWRELPSRFGTGLPPLPSGTAWHGWCMTTWPATYPARSPYGPPSTSKACGRL